MRLHVIFFTLQHSARLDSSRFVRPRSFAHTTAGSLVCPIVFSTNQRLACTNRTGKYLIDQFSLVNNKDGGYLCGKIFCCLLNQFLSCCMRERYFQMKIFVYDMLLHLSHHTSPINVLFSAGGLKSSELSYLMFNSLPGISKNISTKQQSFPDKNSKN